jgi:hypothetical protein
MRGTRDNSCATITLSLICGWVFCVHIRDADECRLHLSNRSGEARDLFVLLLILLLASHCIALHVLVLVVEEQEQPQHREGPVEWEDKRNKLTNTFFSHRATTPSTPTSTS